MSDLTHISVSFQGNRGFRWMWYKPYYTERCISKDISFGTQVVEGQIYEITWKAAFKSWPAQRIWINLLTARNSHGAQILIILNPWYKHVFSLQGSLQRPHPGPAPSTALQKSPRQKSGIQQSLRSTLSSKSTNCVDQSILRYFMTVFYYSLPGRTLWSYDLTLPSRCMWAGCADPSLTNTAHDHCHQR